MIWLTILKYVCLVIAIYFTYVNIGRLVSKEGVHWQNILIMSVNIAAVIALHFEAGV